MLHSSPTKLKLPNSSYYLGWGPSLLQIQNNCGNANVFKWTAVYFHLNETRMWTRFRKGNGREREERARGAVVAIECAWLLQLSDNWWSPTLKFQAIWIPGSSFSVVFSSIGKILSQGHVGIPPLLRVFTL